MSQGHRQDSSAASFRERVVVSAGTGLRVFDRDGDGIPRPAFDIAGKGELITGAPAITADGRFVYAVDEAGWVTKASLGDGAVQWQQRVMAASNVGASPAVTSGGGLVLSSLGGTIASLDASGRSRLARRPDAASAHHCRACREKSLVVRCRW